MSRKKTFVGALAKQEVETLEQGYKYGKAVDFRQRCQLLLLSERGYEVKQIAGVLEVCSQTVYTTIKDWQQEGLAGIIRKKGQGRKPNLQVDNAEHVEAVKQAVEKYAQSSSLILEELYTQLDIEAMSKRSLRRFLKKVVTAGNAFADG